MVQTFMDVLSKLNTKSRIESRNISHDVGLAKHVIITKQGFIRWTVQGDDVTEHPSMLIPQVLDIPIDALR